MVSGLYECFKSVCLYPLHSFLPIPFCFLWTIFSAFYFILFSMLHDLLLMFLLFLFSMFRICSVLLFHCSVLYIPTWICSPCSKIILFSKFHYYASAINFSKSNQKTKSNIPKTKSTFFFSSKYILRSFETNKKNKICYRRVASMV